MPESSTSDFVVIVPDAEEPASKNEEAQENLQPVMKSLFVVSNVCNRYARSVVTSKYINPDTRAQEATFSIVLPDTAFIIGFVMEIKGKEYEAYVKEKEKAKEEYDQAVASGRAAAHVAVSARDSNNFTVSVNVEPQSDVTFILTYEELLVRKHGKYELVINLHPGQLIEELGVDVNIIERKLIEYIETPALRSGNEIINEVTKNKYATINKDEDGAIHISFHPTIEQQKEIAEFLKKDEVKDENKGISGQFVVQYDVERDPVGEVLVNDGHFVHFFAPSDVEPIPKHVIFILDVSGSMAGTKLKQLREAMTIILKELNPNDYFNLVKFSDKISVLESTYEWNNVEIPAESSLPQSFKANLENIKSVQAVVDNITDDGCTNIYDALIVGLRLASKGISHLKQINEEHMPQPMIIFLTDGEPNVSESNPDKIIEMVGHRNDSDNKSAVFTLAFGDSADKEFLKELALQNSGFLRNIYEAADASLQLQDFYKEISSPVLTNVKFIYSDKVKELTKHNFYILFDGSELVTVGKIDEMSDDFVFVEAFATDTRCAIFPTIRSYSQPKKKEDYGSLERLWAYMTIKQLLDKKYENKPSNEDVSDDKAELNTTETDTKTKEKEIAEKQALNLALKYSFVTPLTSLVVVKPDEPPSEEKLENSNVGLQDFEAIYNTCALINNCSLEDDDPIVQACSSGTMYFAPARMLKCCAELESVDIFGIVEEPITVQKMDMNCNVKNNVATTTEKRRYVNSNDKAREITYTMALPDRAVLRKFLMGIEGDVFEATGRDEMQVTDEYLEAVSNGLTAALINLQDSTKVIVTIHMAPYSEVTILVQYEKCLENKNGKYTVDVNLYRDSRTEEMMANVFLNEIRPIKNVDISSLRSGNETIKNEYTTVNKTNENEIHVEFIAMSVHQDEIVAALKGTVDNFSCNFTVEYEVEPDSSGIEDSITPVTLPFPYLLVVKNNKRILIP